MKAIARVRRCVPCEARESPDLLFPAYPSRPHPSNISTPSQSTTFRIQCNNTLFSFTHHGFPQYESFFSDRGLAQPPASRHTTASHNNVTNGPKLDDNNHADGGCIWALPLSVSSIIHDLPTGKLTHPPQRLRTLPRLQPLLPVGIGVFQKRDLRGPAGSCVSAARNTVR